MVQTDRRAETARRTDREQERTQQRKSRETGLSPAQALEAILSGGSWEQLPPEGVLALSHTLGNAALGEMMAMRFRGPELAAIPLPKSPLSAEPMEGPSGEPEWAEAPAFGGESVTALAPLEL